MHMDEITVFPPHGFVKLVKWSGNETDIVNAARVSFHNEVQELETKDIGLLKFLMRNRHGSPFEQGFLSHWHIRLPVFVMREWVRHRIGTSTNEESGRYVQLRPDFYIPEVCRTQFGKPGAYSFKPFEDLASADNIRFLIEAHCKESYRLYENLMKQGLAKEQARMVLPVNVYTEIRWTANSRSLMNFLSLRNEENAMYEIRMYARAMEEIFSKHMPNVHKAFNDSGRVSP